MAHRINTAPLAKLTRLPNGWVQVEGYLPIGVLEYPEVQVPDGQGGTRPRRELLPPEEFCKPEVLDLYRVSPVLVGHPRVNGVMGVLNPSTTRGAVSSGVVRELAEEDGRRRVTLVIHDQAAVDDLPEKHHLSDGYEMSEDMTPGVWEGQSYDLVQRNIRPNHVAIVRRGRAGAASALRLNGAPMKAKIRVNGRDFEVPAGLAQAIISSRKAAYKPRRPGRVNAEGDDPAAEGEGAATGMTTVSAGGTDYDVPTELVMALVAGLALTVTVGDQTITGAFSSDADAQEEEQDDQEMTPDTAPASVPMALNALGAGRRGRQAAQQQRANAAADQAKRAAERDAHAADRAELAQLRAQVDRLELAPVLQRALGTRYNSAEPIEDSMRAAVVRRWPNLADKVRTETGVALRSRFEVLQAEIAAGNFEELVARGNAAPPAAPPDAHKLAEQANERLKARLQNGKGA